MNIQQISNYANFTGIKYFLSGRYHDLSELDDKRYGYLKKQLAEMDQKLNNETPCDIYVAAKEITGQVADSISIVNRDKDYKYYELDTTKLARVSDIDERDAMIYLKYNHLSKDKNHSSGDCLYISHETVADAEESVWKYNFEENIVPKIKMAFNIATGIVKKDR